jgi:NitT/TauT family transport system ATP-binding protein
MVSPPKPRGHAPAIVLDNAAHDYVFRDRPPITVGPALLEVERGEFVAIVGPDACGKSTLLKMIAGLLEVTEGGIRVDGETVKAAERGIGLVFREPALVEWRTTLGNVLLEAELRNLDVSLYEARARGLLALVGLSGYEDRRPHELPADAAQRVAICRALVHEPGLLLLDDPFGKMDPIRRQRLAHDLQYLPLAPSATVVLATSWASEAVLLADRVAVLSSRGQVLKSLLVELPRPRLLDKDTTAKIAEYCTVIYTYLEA